MFILIKEYWMGVFGCPWIEESGSQQGQRWRTSTPILNRATNQMDQTATPGFTEMLQKAPRDSQIITSHVRRWVRGRVSQERWGAVFVMRASTILQKTLWVLQEGETGISLLDDWYETGDLHTCAGAATAVEFSLVKMFLHNLTFVPRSVQEEVGENVSLKTGGLMEQSAPADLRGPQK